MAAPGMKPKRIRPYLHAFFDLPFGELENTRSVLVPPRAGHYPC